MKISAHWRSGVKVKKLGAISGKMAKSSKSNQKEDICLTCKEKRCRGTCKNFKR